MAASDYALGLPLQTMGPEAPRLKARHLLVSRPSNGKIVIAW
jgi:hypothetical protein